MSNLPLVLKNKQDASGAPDPADIVVGEMAWNGVEGKLYGKKTDDSIVEVGAGASEEAAMEWNLDNFSYSGRSYDLSGISWEHASLNDIYLQDIRFSSDGTKLYVLDSLTNEIYQHILSTPWDVTTLSYASKSLAIGTQDNTMYGFCLSSDGLHLFACGAQNDGIYRYDLMSAWDISTASYHSTLTVSGSNFTAIDISTDGDKLYVVNTTNPYVIREYTLGTAYDLTTASNTSEYLWTNELSGGASGLALSPDGLHLYLLSANEDALYQYSLATAWDLDTISYASQTTDISSQSGNPTGVDFRGDGMGFVMCENDGDVLYEYMAPFDILASELGNDSDVDGVTVKDALNNLNAPATESIIVAASDETTDLETGTGKLTFRMPYAFTVTEVRASVTTAPTGAALQVDINEGGTSILSTEITIDDGEKTSTTAATAPVISDAALADDAEITLDIDQVGSTTAGAGLKVYLIGTKA